MKTHSWTQAKRDLGAIRLDTVWTCPTCGAEAGPVYPDTPGVEEPPSQQPYAPMRGLPPVSHDCDEAQQQIQALTEAQEEEQAFRDSMPHYLDPHNPRDRRTWREMQMGSLGTVDYQSPQAEQRRSPEAREDRHQVLRDTRALEDL
jgi:hypothetical protein